MKVQGIWINQTFRFTFYSARVFSSEIWEIFKNAFREHQQFRNFRNFITFIPIFEHGVIILNRSNNSYIRASASFQALQTNVLQPPS